MTEIVSTARRAILDRLGLIPEVELAQALDISGETMRDWRKPGSTPRLPWVTLGRKVYYRVADVQRWIEQNRCPPQPP